MPDSRINFLTFPHYFHSNDETNFHINNNTHIAHAPFLQIMFVFLGQTSDRIRFTHVCDKPHSCLGRGSQKGSMALERSGSQ
jgi:hypothetical protein